MLIFTTVLDTGFLEFYGFLSEITLQEDGNGALPSDAAPECKERRILSYFEFHIYMSHISYTPVSIVLNTLTQGHD